MASLPAVGPPPIPDYALERHEVIAEVSKRLDELGILAVMGSTGMGKTTLAAMVVSAESNLRWLWLNCRGREVDQIDALLWQVGHEVDRRRDRTGIVIDDLDTQGDSRPLESNLLSLLFTIRARNGRIILTSSAGLPPRLRLALSIAPDQPYRVPRLTDPEIHDFLLSQGCPPDLATSWTTVVALTTSGHPQLVNARIQALGRAGFPQPTATDLATPPLDVAETRLEARRLIAAELTPPERELLYRLSLCMDDFPRDQVLSIANLPKPIDFPGEAFDGLVGPWIEVTGPGRFAVSPLVKGCGGEVHDTDWMRRTRSGIASSMLARSTLSPFEVSEIFTQGFLAADSLVLGQMIVGLMGSRIEDPTVARFLSWIAHVGIDKSSTDLPVDEPTRLLFRILQYRIASLTDPTLALRINQVTEQMLATFSDPLARHSFEVMWCTQILFRVGVRYEASVILSYFTRWLTLIDTMRDEVDLYDTPAPIPELAGPDGRTDPASTFAILFPYRLNSVKDLQDLTTFLEDTKPALRERMLRWPARDQTVADNLLNQVWLAEYQSESPNWRGLVIALDELRKKASAWNAAPSALAAASIASRTFDENLGEPSLAIDVLDVTEEDLGPSLALQHARALLYYNAGEHQSALDIWTDILPKLESAPQSKDLGIVFAYANAARSAGHLSKWAQAVDLFLGAHRCSLQFDQLSLTVGLLADAAFAAWKAGTAEKAVCLFRKTLEMLAKIPNDPSEEREFALHKRVGHVLMWVADHDENDVGEKFVEPPPGCCSNLDAPTGIADLNPTPLPMSWAILAKIEYKYTGKTTIYARLMTDLSGRKYPAFLFRMSTLAMDISYADLSMSQVAKVLFECVTALNAMESQRKRGLNVWDENDGLNETPHFDSTTISQLKRVMISLLLGLVSRRSDRVIENLKTMTAEPQMSLLPDEMRKFLEDIIHMMEGGEKQGVKAILYRGDDYMMRIVAGLAVSNAASSAPDDVMCAHVLLFNGWEQGMYVTDVSEDAASVVCRAWIAMQDRKFLLRSPAVTFPAIITACNNSYSGWTKVASVILAARAATSLRLPEETVRSLRTL